jgi:hypothetical protein
MLQENLQISGLVRAVGVELEPKAPYIVAKFAASLFVATLSVATTGAQVVTGQLGSAEATTTIDGKQLPAPRHAEQQWQQEPANSAEGDPKDVQSVAEELNFGNNCELQNQKKLRS